MLARPHRLSQNRAIVAVMKRGHTLSYSALRFRFFTSSRSATRLAVVVSLHVSKRAVVRNRVRRQLHAIIAPLMQQFLYPVDGVLLVQPGLEKRTFQELSKIVNVIFKQAQLVK